MSVKRIITSYFSPTGGTKKTAMAIQEGLLTNPAAEDTEILSFNCLTIKSRKEKTPVFTDEDLIFFCYPVYKGRMPAAFYDWNDLKGNGASAVVVSVYGNRAIDDAGRETMAFLQDHGFKITGHIEAVAEHSLERTLAEGRPDAEDIKDLKAAADEVLKAHLSGQIKELSFDRETALMPYAPFPGVPEPAEGDACDKCNRCAGTCPMGIIDPETGRVPEEKKKLCIACSACMTACRKGRRDFAPELKKMINEKMQAVKAANSDRKPVVLHLA